MFPFPFLFAAIATEVGSPYFAVLTWLPESDRLVKSNGQMFCGKDGAILLFDGSGPKPVAIWTVMKVYSSTFKDFDQSSLITVKFLDHNVYRRPGEERFHLWKMVKSLSHFSHM